MMKKILIISLVLLVILVIAGSASAWGRPYHRYGPGPGPGFGIFIGPPVILGPPVFYRDYPPYYRYYDRGYNDYNTRVWVPGHWEGRPTPYGWKRVWVPGYWRYDY